MNYSVICINGSWKESWVIISHVAVIKRFVLFSINIFFFSQVYTFHKTAERGRKYHSFTPHLQFKVHKDIARVAGDNSKHLIPTWSD